MIICVTGVLRRTGVGNWFFDNLYRSHLQSQVSLNFRVLLRTPVTQVIIFNQGIISFLRNCLFMLLVLQNYKNRLQAQGIYLDFLDEPVDSLRRKREGTYASYIFGSDGKRVKVSTIILIIVLPYKSSRYCPSSKHLKEQKV